MKLPDKFAISFAIVTINHVIGVIGLNTDYRAHFERISWLNLLITMLLMLFLHNPPNARLLLFALPVFLLGMAVEIIGVKTGIPFGHYHYTDVLGWSVGGVPLIIGVNWVLLTYSTGSLVSRFTESIPGRIVIGALAMVVLDMLLEGFAIRHNYWVWQADGTPPILNFSGWFITSLVAHFIYQKLQRDNCNALANLYIPILVLFLLTDSILSWF